MERKVPCDGTAEADDLERGGEGSGFEEAEGLGAPHPFSEIGDWFFLGVVESKRLGHGVEVVDYFLKGS